MHVFLPGYVSTIDKKWYFVEKYENSQNTSKYKSSIYWTLESQTYDTLQLMKRKKCSFIFGTPSAIKKS